jgi:dTDP-4-dehydrorhamnose 3,5-epimerase
MNATAAPLAGVRVIEPPRFPDDRGWFAELWNEERYRAQGIDARFVQNNVSWSTRGVLRGMHFQHPRGQGKLITVLAGAVFDAVVDVRLGSPTFGRWYGRELSQQNGVQLWVSAGFAHGFLVLSEAALVHYSCTTAYDPSCDMALAWDDPDVGIEWPAVPWNISDKDRAAPRLAEHIRSGLPGLNDSEEQE